MPFSNAECDRANQLQEAAARDQSPQVRLVAGPGSGKSKAIEERVCWLLAEGVDPNTIFATSFTRASAKDLRHRIESCCEKSGHATQGISVSTLHSLALRILQNADLLTTFSVSPIVLDDWDCEHLIDNEFAHKHKIGRSRSREIREYHEAFWNTGQRDHPNYVKPNPPVTDEEESLFLGFHQSRTQCYACVLPGEIVQKCVESIDAGILDPVQQINIEHLIVDEYQDLNPIDLKFVDALASRGVKIFIAGDDDQSIYSFRFASPAGIQDFPTKYLQAGLHTLEACFRCAPAVLDAAQAVITANPGSNRIPKRFSSLYKSAEPPVAGVVHRWRFQTELIEAQAIASSCKGLISQGLDPRSILILLSNRRALVKPIVEALRDAGVPHEPPRAEGFLDSNAGRFAYSLVRIACKEDDYVAHRGLIEMIPGIGIGTCSGICDSVVGNNLNYKDVFYRSLLPDGVFPAMQTKALGHAYYACKEVSGLSKDDLLGSCRKSIDDIIKKYYEINGFSEWIAVSSPLPDEMLLSELRDYLGADNEDQEASILDDVARRTGKNVQVEDAIPSRVRIMTMHGAKGLSGHFVFIPGLEESSLPGAKKKAYPGLVAEAARMLYVSITRARAACVMSYAKTRYVNGVRDDQPPSRFALRTAGAFADRSSGLTLQEVSVVLEECGRLNL